jgi:hypothetical protein
MLRGPGVHERDTRLKDEILPRARDAYGRERCDSATAEGASLTVHEAIELGRRSG